MYLAPDWISDAKKRRMPESVDVARIESVSKRSNYREGLDPNRVQPQTSVTAASPSNELCVRLCIPRSSPACPFYATIDSVSIQNHRTEENPERTAVSVLPEAPGCARAMTRRSARARTNHPANEQSKSTIRPVRAVWHLFSAASMPIRWNKTCPAFVTSVTAQPCARNRAR